MSTAQDHVSKIIRVIKASMARNGNGAEAFARNGKVQELPPEEIEFAQGYFFRGRLYYAFKVYLCAESLPQLIVAGGFDSFETGATFDISERTSMYREELAPLLVKAFALEQEERQRTEAALQAVSDAATAAARAASGGATGASGKAEGTGEAGSGGSDSVTAAGCASASQSDSEAGVSADSGAAGTGGQESVSGGARTVPAKMRFSSHKLKYVTLKDDFTAQEQQRLGEGRLNICCHARILLKGSSFDLSTLNDRLNSAQGHRLPHNFALNMAMNQDPVEWVRKVDQASILLNCSGQPVPAKELEKAVGYNYRTPDLMSRASEHGCVLDLYYLEMTRPMPLVFMNFAMILGALCCLEETVGIMLNGTVYDPLDYLSLVKELDNNSLMPQLHTFIRISTNKDGTINALSRGLNRFLIPEMELKNSPLSRDELLTSLHAIIARMVQVNHPVPDGGVCRTYNGHAFKFTLVRSRNAPQSATYSLREVELDK